MPLLDGPDPGTWNSLALAGGNVFATHTWASCWWDHYGTGTARPLVLTDADGDDREPRVVLPLVTTGRGLRQARVIGHGPADELGPACAPQDRPVAGELLAAALRDGRLRADVVLLQDVSTTDAWWGTLPSRQVSTEPSPVLDLAPYADWDAFLASCSRNLRGQVRGKANRLRRDHDVVVRLADEASLDADLETFFNLHGRRWDGDSLVLDPVQRAFTADVAGRFLAEGWLRLWTLDLDGRPAASALQLEFGGAALSYQLGRDPAHDHASVGFVLLTHTMRAALEAGCTEFRFLRGDEGYKSRFATSDEAVQTVALPRTLRGRAATTAAVARRRRV